MRKFRCSVAVLLTALVIASTSLQPVQAKEKQDYGINEYITCTINLLNSTHNCYGLIPISFVQPPSGGQTVMRINTAGFASTRFIATYNSAPSGWSIHIGDSSSNDGWGGDAGTQSNDAEVHVASNWLSAYASDYGSSQMLLNIQNPVWTGQQVSLTVQNNALSYITGSFQSGGISSPNLFALAGQYDATGAVNYDIYAAFNRTISGGRVGSGVGQVIVTLSR